MSPERIQGEPAPDEKAPRMCECGHYHQWKWDDSGIDHICGGYREIMRTPGHYVMTRCDCPAFRPSVPRDDTPPLTTSFGRFLTITETAAMMDQAHKDLAAENASLRLALAAARRDSERLDAVDNACVAVRNVAATDDERMAGSVVLRWSVEMPGKVGRTRPSIRDAIDARYLTAARAEQGEG